jgi:hypothetical protein
MNFVKKTLPLAFGMLVCAYAVAEFYIPHHAVRDFTTDLQNWGIIMTAAAYVLGAINILQFNLPKIRRRERDWQFKVILLAAAGIMFTAGMLELALKPGSAGSVASSTDPALVASGKARIDIDAPSDVMVQIGAAGPRAVVDASGVQASVEVPPGKTNVRVFRRAAGYLPFEQELTLAAGDVKTVHADPPIQWGKEGRVFVWLYDHIFAPCNATMFALLAFFVASAAFRAFRARNLEAGLLLGGAVLVMLARVPIGRAISETLPSIGQWILDVPNNGSRRAIMMGAAVGAIATGLRILLGLERSHLGSDE